MLPLVTHAQTGSCWENFRGDAALKGVSTATLPAQPEELWSFNTGSGIKAAPVVCEGIIVAGTMNGALFGITLDGKLKWKILTGNSIEAPALVVDGVVYAGNLEGKLLALDLQSGKILWTYECDNSIMGSPSFYQKGDKRVLMVGSYDYYLHGIDPESGKGLWKYETDNFINGSCAIYAGAAVFGGCDGKIHMVDALSGKVRSSIEVASYVASSAGVDNNTAFVGDYDGRFSAVDLLDQKMAWTFENPEQHLPFLGSPAIGKKHVFIGNRDKFLYCLNKRDGKLVWKYNTGSRVDASPVLVGDLVLCANMRGDVFLIDEKTGSPVWTWELGTPVSSNPAVIEGHFFVAGDDGRLYCFGKK